MQIQTGNNLSFTGKKEVLYNLGKALEESRNYANAKAVTKDVALDEEKTFGKELASIRAYIDSATEDDAFVQVAKDIKESLSTPIKSKTDGAIDNLTLPEIARSEHGFDKKQTRGVPLSLEKFQHELLRMVGDKKLDKNSVKTFVNEIKPEYMRRNEKNWQNTHKSLSEYSIVGGAH